MARYPRRIVIEERPPSMSTTVVFSVGFPKKPVT